MNYLWAAQTGFVAQAKAAFAYLYALVLGLGGPGLFFLALADSSFISVPEGNDFLIIVLSTGATWERMLYLVAMTTAGSVAGCSLLYMVGRRGGDFMHRRISLERVERFKRLYDRWGSLSIIVPALLPPPCPFKIFVLSAGVFGLSYPRFFLAVLIGRFTRYLTWGVLALLFGELAKTFLKEHFPIVGIVLMVLVVGGAVGYFLNRTRRNRSAVAGRAA